MNKGITIAGNLIVDHVKLIDSYPEVGMLTNIRSVSSSIGGCAGNTICDIAKIDTSVPLKCIGKVGGDSDGEFIKKILTDLGVNIDGVKTEQGEPSSFTDVMTSLETNERTFFQARGANAKFGLCDIDFDNLDTDIFHIGYALLLDEFDKEDPEYGTVMARALKMAQDRGIRTSLDVVSEASDRFKRIVTPCLKYCNYAIINEVEAAQTTGISVRREDKSIDEDAVKAAIAKLFELGVKDVVCIHCPEGGWYATADGSIYYHDALYLPRSFIKGKVGAGDAFCAGMLYSLYKGFDPEYSLRVAGAAAGANLSANDSISGLRPFEEMMKLDEEFGTKR